MKNSLIIVSGHSGAGKTSVMRSVMENEIVSFTTRSIRDNEIDGKDYIFISQEEFNKLYLNNGLAEYTEYPPNSGRYYGIQKEELETKLHKGNAFVIVDFNGANQLIRQYKKVLKIFIWCSRDEAIQRMQLRGENPDVIDSRMATYWKEKENSVVYDYVISNPDGHFEQTVNIVKNIIESRCL